MQVYGIIGNPVEHSLSPPMHETAYEELGIDARYCSFRVEEDDVEKAVRGAIALGIDGLNVTVPYKRTVAELEVVETDEIAERIGAVNTLSFEENSVKGYNTDAKGAWRTLEEHGVEIEGENVVVVGAGGAARAIAYELGARGASLEIANRTETKARSLAEEVSDFSGTSVSSLPLDELGNLVSGADVLINATSVGMEEDRSPVPSEFLHPELTVFDVVYTPLKTRLLRDAEDAGAETVDGAWMLVYQGVEAFEIWTGQKAPVEEMNRVVRNHLSD